MEQIYTIPINMAFEKSQSDPSCGCPLCTICRELEEGELDRILGAAMMEPDIRIETNKQGFCRLHYDMMFVRKNRLGMALTMQSHLDELAGDIKNGGFLSSGNGDKQYKRITKYEASCYICKRLDDHINRMTDSLIYIWDTDVDFREKFKSQPYFCLPHYRLMLEYAQRRLTKKKLPEFVLACAGVVEPYMDTLRGDIDWFCKKFDYRFTNEPWYNSKDAIERAIKFLRSDLHNKY